MMMIFRFDDVSINTDIDAFVNILCVIHAHRPGARIFLGVSPIVFSKTQLPANQKTRVHPSTLTAHSRLHPYYHGHRCGLPDRLLAAFWQDSRISFAGHGLLHVDHRLLGRKAQEMSIVTSCHLARGERLQELIFIPPYNKWDSNTEAICEEHCISLIRFESGWKHALYNDYDPNHTRYYAHPYDFTADTLNAWFVKAGVTL